MQIDFIAGCGWCSSHGCPETYFNNKNKFDNERDTKAYEYALRMIERNNQFLPRPFNDGSPLKTEKDVENFLKELQKEYPYAKKQYRLLSCKHGKILYDRIIRFENVTEEQEKGLVEKIITTLPKRENEKSQPHISLFFVKTK